MVMFGFLLVYGIRLQENYVGSSTRFRKTGESLPSLRSSEILEPMCIEIGLAVSNMSIALPETLYSNFSAINVACNNLYLKLSALPNIMDMVVAGDLTVSFAHNDIGMFRGVKIGLQRLFSSDGLVNYATSWDYSIDSIIGHVSPEGIRHFILFLKCFLYHFSDHDRISGIAEEDIPQNTLQLQMQSVQISHIDVSYAIGAFAAVLLMPSGIYIHTNNLSEDETIDTTLYAIPRFDLSFLQSADFGSQTFELEIFRFTAPVLVKHSTRAKLQSIAGNEQVAYLTRNDAGSYRLKSIILNYRNSSEEEAETGRFSTPKYFDVGFVTEYMDEDYSVTNAPANAAFGSSILKDDPLADHLRIFRRVRDGNSSSGIVSSRYEIVHSPKKDDSFDMEPISTEGPCGKFNADNRIDSGMEFDIYIQKAVNVVITPRSFTALNEILATLHFVRND